MRGEAPLGAAQGPQGGQPPEVRQHIRVPGTRTGRAAIWPGRFPVGFPLAERASERRAAARATPGRARTLGPGLRGGRCPELPGGGDPEARGARGAQAGPGARARSAELRPGRRRPPNPIPKYFPPSPAQQLASENTKGCSPAPPPPPRLPNGPGCSWSSALRWTLASPDHPSPRGGETTVPIPPGAPPRQARVGIGRRALGKWVGPGAHPGWRGAQEGVSKRGWITCYK